MSEQQKTKEKKMKFIYKYGFGHAGGFGNAQLLMPKGAEILDVQIQNGKPQLWALVNPENAPEPRNFLIVGTGHQLSDIDLEYIATYQTHDGSLIYHLFEIH